MKTPAQHRKREEQLICELLDDHRYMIVDKLPARDRESMIFEHVNGKQTLVPALCVKLVVPAGSFLGAHIASVRKTKRAIKKR